MAQKLRLEAEMKDNASPAVKKLREELSALQAMSADTRGVTKLNAELAKLQTEAAANASPAVQALRKELAALKASTSESRAITGLNKELAALRQHAGGVAPTAGMKAFGTWLGEAKTLATGALAPLTGLSGILSGIGIGGIAAGASVAGLAGGMKALGDRALDLKELGRQTGLSDDFVARWSQAGQHFGVAEDAMKGMLGSFSAQLPDFQAGEGAMFKELSRWPDTIAKINEDIRQHNPAKALMDAMKQADVAGADPQIQKQVLEAMGFGPDAERLFGDHGLPGFMKELQKPRAVASPEFLAQAQKLRDATTDFNDALRQFENGYGPKFLGLLTDVVKKATQFFTLDRSGAEKAQRDSGATGERERAKANGGAWGEESPEDRKKLMDALRQKSSFEGGSGLLHNASFTTGGTGSGTLQSAIAEGSRSGILAALREAELGLGGSSGAGGGDSEGSGGGFSSGRRGFAARGGHFGGRRGFGAYASGDGGADYGTPSKSLLDFIAKSEGTKGYNTSLGNGRYLPGHHETDLEGKSLKQILDLGKYMRQQPGNPNSSALGRYQMTGETIRDLMGRMHLSGDEKFDGKMQDALASKLIQDEGPRALNRWASLRGGRMGTALGLLKSGSIAPMRSGMAAAGDGVGVGGASVDLAMALRGAGQGDAAHALGHYMSSGLWCADFVNGALAKSGGKGTGSSLARSFFKWGQHVDVGGIRKGDVLVKGSHVGFAEGPAQMHNGRMMIPMISGNHGHRVGEGWAGTEEYEARRGAGPGVGRTAGELPHPYAGRRAGSLPDNGRSGADSASNHKVTVGVEVTGPGRHKSTKVDRDGPMRIETRSSWPSGRNGLLEI